MPPIATEMLGLTAPSISRSLGRLMGDFSFGEPQFGLVASAATWVHPVHDELGIVVSWEEGSAVVIARLDHDAFDPSTGIDGSGNCAWVATPVPVTSAIEDDEGPVGDHWHAWAHGAHWISFNSTDGELSGRWLRIKRLGADLMPLGTTVQVLGPASELAEDFADILLVDLEAYPEPEYTIVTNDHWLAEGPEVNGKGTVYVGVFLKRVGVGNGHLVIQVDEDGALVGTPAEFVDGDTADGSHANLASACRVRSGWAGASGTGTGSHEYQVLAPSAVSDGSTLIANQLRLLYTSDFTTLAKLHQIEVEGAQLAMATQVVFPDGQRVITFRLIADPASVSLGSPDDGDIARVVLDAACAELVPMETGLADGGLANRPHVAHVATVLGEWLITGYDTDTREGYLRVESIER